MATNDAKKRDELLLEFTEAAHMCTDPNVQAQIMALRAHAEMVTTQLESLESNFTQFGKQLLHQIVRLQK